MPTYTIVNYTSGKVVAALETHYPAFVGQVVELPDVETGSTSHLWRVVKVEQFNIFIIPHTPDPSDPSSY